VDLPLLVCPHREIAFGEIQSWRSIPEVALRENVCGASPRQPTTFLWAWSDTALHLRFHCIDHEPWGTITNRDGPLWEEEVVEVFVDPIGDFQSYFEFEVNPLNTVLDLVLRKNRSGYRKDFSWDCEGLRTEVARTNNGWDTEMLIPFAALVADAPRVGAQWRVNLCRIDRTRKGERELSAWSPTLQPTFHIIERFGTLQFG
jgi:Carbohydrate-binding family 9